jgi:hypothetical protein
MRSHTVDVKWPRLRTGLDSLVRTVWPPDPTGGIREGQHPHCLATLYTGLLVPPLGY